MLKANHSAWAMRLFDLYINYKFRQRFKKIEIIAEGQPQTNAATLVIANHISWWDGFFIWHLNKKHIHKKFHLMMLEEQLMKFSFFRKLGAYSIQPTKKSILESIAYTNELLSDKNNMVVMYPQGKIHSIYDNHFQFMAGVSRIAQHTTNLLFVAVFIDYGSVEKPTVTIRTQYTDSRKYTSSEDLQSAYQLFYSQAQQAQTIDTI